MYFNDIHILIYALFGVIGIIVGILIDYITKSFIKEEKILSKKNFNEFIRINEINYILILTVVISYIVLLYKFGIYNKFIQNLELMKMLIILPILFSIIIIDLKKQIIPNRLNLIIFEIALIFLFINGWTHIYIAKDLLIGGLIGGGIFLTITLIGGLIAGKEAMGLGDVKLMGALGLCFGVNEILLISVLSFLIGAIISILLLILRKKKANQYIPFGPFIVIATIINIFIPFEILFNILMKIFSLGMY